MSVNILINGPISPEIILSGLECFNSQTDSGGFSIFIGQVRSDEVNCKQVKAIEYSAYEALVNKEADKIFGCIREEFSEVKLIRLFHSVGLVNTGEISLAVMVSAVHRDQAMEACKKIVELVKENLPIWKKEIFTDYSYRWEKDNKA